MKVIGILLIIGGGLFALLAFDEFSRYNDLADNPFRGIAANSAVYLAGISATAILSGIGFLLAPTNRVTPPPAQQPSADPQ